MIPAFVAPQLATLVERPPQTGPFVHEIKYDGYRLLARVVRGRARLYTRHAKDWTDRFPGIAEAVGRLRVGTAWIDGEVVAGDGTFEALQQALSEGRPDEMVYYIFDAPYLDGKDGRSLPLERRKARLGERVPSEGPVRFAEHLEGSGDDVFREACALKLEGIVSKRRDGPYRSGRGMDWLKAKCRLEQEFVIVGWSDPEGSRAGFGSLLLAVQGPEGLVYAGRVGTGFDDAMLRRLHRELESLPRPIAPVKNAPRSRRFHWVEPRRVAQVSFSNWTRDNLLRHPVFLGLREDKHPSEIAREIPRKL